MNECTQRRQRCEPLRPVQETVSMASKPGEGTGLLGEKTREVCQGEIREDPV